MLPEVVKYFMQLPPEAYHVWEEELQHQRDSGLTVRRSGSLLASGGPSGPTFARSLMPSGTGGDGIQLGDIQRAARLLGSGIMGGSATTSSNQPPRFFGGGLPLGGAPAPPAPGANALPPLRNLEVEKRRLTPIKTAFMPFIIGTMPAGTPPKNGSSIVGAPAADHIKYVVVQNLGGAGTDMEIDFNGGGYNGLVEVLLDARDAITAQSTQWFDADMLGRVVAVFQRADDGVLQALAPLPDGPAEMNRNITRLLYNLLWKTALDALEKRKAMAAVAAIAMDEIRQPEMLKLTGALSRLLSLWDPQHDAHAASSQQLANTRQMLRAALAAPMARDVVNLAEQELKMLQREQAELKAASAAEVDRFWSNAVRINDALYLENRFGHDGQAAPAGTNIAYGRPGLDNKGQPLVIRVFLGIKDEKQLYPTRFLVSTPGKPAGDEIANINALATEVLGQHWKIKMEETVAIRKFIRLWLTGEGTAEQKAVVDELKRISTPALQLKQVLEQSRRYLDDDDHRAIAALKKKKSAMKARQGDGDASSSSDSDEDEQTGGRSQGFKRARRRQRPTTAASGASDLDDDASGKKARIEAIVAAGGPTVYRSANDVKRLLYALRLSRKSTWLLMFSEKMPLPFEFIDFQMWLHLRTGQACFLRSGLATALHCVSDAAVLFSQAVDNFQVNIGTRFTEGLFVYNHDNLHFVPHTIVKGYKGGGGARLFDYNRHRATFLSGAERLPFDIMPCIVPRCWDSQSILLDFTGELPPELYSSEESRNGLQYPTARVYRKILNQERTQATPHRLSPNYFLSEQAPRWSTLCTRTSITVWDPTPDGSGRGTVSRVVEGHSALGPYVNHDVFRTARGANEYLGYGWEGTRPRWT